MQEGEELIGFAALNISALSLQVRASQSFMIRGGLVARQNFREKGRAGGQKEDSGTEKDRGAVPDFDVGGQLEFSRRF